MQQVMVKAALAKAKGDLEVAKANILVYLGNPAGIGEHSDIMEALLEQVDKMAHAQDRIDILETF